MNESRACPECGRTDTHYPKGRGDHGFIAEPKRCHACYDSFSGPWCDNCDTWPCRCVTDEQREAIEKLGRMVG